MANYKKLGKNILLLTLGNFSSKILTFLLVPFYTAILTTSEYGTADLITTTINLIMPVFTLLIYESVMRYSLDANNYSQVFSWGFYITFFGCLLLSCFLPLLNLFVSLKDYIFLFFLYYVSLAFYNLMLQFAKGIEKVGVYSIAGIINTLVYIGTNILFLLVFKLGIQGYIYSAVISHLITAIVVFLGIKAYRNLVSIWKLEKAQLSLMLKYSLPMIPSSISWWINSSADKYILIFICGVQANGLYSVANKIPTILSLLVTIFIGAWQISAVEDFGSDESKEFYEDIYQKYSSLLYIGGAFLIGGVKILADILFSNDFYSAWSITPILIYAFILSSLASFFGSIYTSAKKTKMLLYSTLFAAIVNIGLNIFLVKKFTLYGIAIATAAGYFIMLIIRILDTHKFFSIKIGLGKNLFLHLILIIEMVLVCTNSNYMYLPAIACILIICIICRHVLMDIIKQIFHKKTKIKKNKRL